VDWLEHHWARAFLRRQPLGKIRSYFGESIGVYFAFVGFYNWWLFIASIVGIAAFVVQ
jgi:hypothetical protein